MSDPTIWIRVYKQPGTYNTVSVSPEGAIRIQAGRRVVVRDSIPALVAERWLPEPRR